MNFTTDFVEAFNHAMLFEVGPFWDPTDEDVIYGRIDTREQRKKVGYVNIPQDRGGETKYGLAQKSNRSITIRDIDLPMAMTVYHEDYWLKGKCNKLDFALSLMHFDGVVNHGFVRAAKFLQRAVNVEDDGLIGNVTINATLEYNTKDIINHISDQRTKFYHSIVENDSSQSIFLNGWLRRITSVTEYCLNYDNTNTEAI